MGRGGGVLGDGDRSNAAGPPNLRAFKRAGREDKCTTWWATPFASLFPRLRPTSSRVKEPQLFFPASIGRDADSSVESREGFCFMLFAIE